MARKTLELDDVKDLDLLKLSTKVANAYSKDASSVSGSVYAYLAKQLLASEIKPGGPYQSKTKETMPELNATIGRLFMLMGKPLPNIDEHLRTLQPEDISVTGLIAIKLYNSARQTAELPSTPSLSSKPYLLARTTLEGIDEPIRTQALKFLARVEAADTTKEIALISHFTATAVHADISTDELDTLGEANIHSWIAYMIYDHIIDNETSSRLLPVANVCMRLALDRYRNAVPPQSPLQEHISQYFDQVDGANAWELLHARFKASKTTIHTAPLPNYQENEVLARRSAVHILGPIIVASQYSSLAQKSLKLQQLISGLRQYLIARQLSDDIHDWREDLTSGQISVVVTHLLQNHGVLENTTYKIDELMTALQDDFLHHTSQSMSKNIIVHTHKAMNSLKQAGCSTSSDLIGLVTRLESMAKESIEQQNRFLEFQNEYEEPRAMPLKEVAQQD
jgi:hypothetical protein